MPSEGSPWTDDDETVFPAILFRISVKVLQATVNLFINMRVDILSRGFRELHICSNDGNGFSGVVLFTD